MAYVLEYTRRYQQDYEDAIDYLATTCCARAAARRLAVKLRKAHETLAEFPTAYPIHRFARELGKEYRVCPVESYVVVYRIDGESVMLARLLHKRQNIVTHVE